MTDCNYSEVYQYFLDQRLNYVTEILINKQIKIGPQIVKELNVRRNIWDQEASFEIEKYWRYVGLYIS